MWAICGSVGAAAAGAASAKAAAPPSTSMRIMSSLLVERAGEARAAPFGCRGSAAVPGNLRRQTPSNGHDTKREDDVELYDCEAGFEAQTDAGDIPFAAAP